MATAKQPKNVQAGAAKSGAKSTFPSKHLSARGAKKQPPSLQENLLAELETILDSPGLWMDNPNPLFGGRTPRELMGTEDEHLLREWIGSVKHGMVS